MDVALAGLAILMFLIVMRMPIGFAMAIVGFFGFWYMRGLPAAIATTGERFFSTVLELELTVLPMFVLMGNLVARAGVAQELYRAAQAFLGHRRGGLAMATVVACGGFSAVCGSSLATAATMGRVAMPPMRKYGYGDSLATASIAAGGTLGILIPPSVIMVIYGLMTESSINQLFAAGFLPGIIGVLFYLVAVRWTVWLDPTAGPSGERAPWSERLVALKGVWTVIVLFVVVLGGIYGGIFTPTEAAGIGAAGALVIAISRRVSLRDIIDVAIDSARTSATLFFILIGALIFSNFVNTAGLPEGLLSIIGRESLSPYLVLGMILLIYLVLGCVLESLSMILLTVPIFFPVVAGLDLGIEPKWVLVWFGVIVVMVTEISLITPPVGLNVYVLSSVLPDVKTTTIFKGMLPFIVVDVLRLALFIGVPAIALTLPKLLYG